MSRIPPVSSEEAPAASQRLLERLEHQLGRVSNFLRIMANSPAALEGYLGLSNCLDKGSLPPHAGRRIALLGDCEITANRNGSSNDPKAEAAVRFAVAVARERGH